MDKQKPLIAVAGAGRMGIGIAQVFAYAGCFVDLIDIKDRPRNEAELVLDAACRQITGNLDFFCSLGILTEVGKKQTLDRIRYSAYSSMPDILPKADFVFEAVPEVLSIKEDAFARICSLVSSDTVIASTTSTFMVDTLAAYVTSPQRFMNTHWLNPAYLIPLVEVSPGRSTADHVLKTMFGLLESVGKIPVKCSPSPGFIVPRIQALAMNEAARLVEEGVASPEDIDKATRVGFGLRFAVLGLLEFIDFGGGDILYYASNYLRDALDSERFTSPRVITENMEQGKIGLKTGQGFYDFSSVDISSYQKETIKKFVDLLQHLGLLPKPGVHNLTDYE